VGLFYLISGLRSLSPGSAGASWGSRPRRHRKSRGTEEFEEAPSQATPWIIGGCIAGGVVLLTVIIVVLMFSSGGGDSVADAGKPGKPPPGALNAKGGPKKPELPKDIADAKKPELPKDIAGAKKPKDIGDAKKPELPKGTDEPKKPEPAKVTGDTALDKVLADMDSKVARKAAADSLAKMSPNEPRALVAQKLAGLTESSDTFTRKAIFHALGVWATPAEVPVLIKALDRDDV